MKRIREPEPDQIAYCKRCDCMISKEDAPNGLCKTCDKPKPSPPSSESKRANT